MKYNIIIVGCGGTGGNYVQDLGRYLYENPLQSQCRILIADGDVVEEKNIGRQPFQRRDIGRKKAEVMQEVLTEVFGLKWEDIDLENKTLTVDRNIVKKNQGGGTKHRHISGNSTTVWYYGPCKTESSYRTIDIGDTLVEALKEFKQEQEIFAEQYGDMYMKHYEKEVMNPYTNKPEIKIVNATAEVDVALPEAHLVFVKNNGVFEGTDTCKYPFQVIHYELGIPCRFHDFRDTHATRLIEAGADIKAVSKRLGHSTIEITYNIYVRVTSKMEEEVVSKFEDYTSAFDVPILRNSNQSV